MIALLAFQRLDPGLQEAAADLGASQAQIFRRVVFPQVSPVLVGAAAFSFMLAFDEFLVTNFLVGSDQTVPTLVFQRIRRTIDPTINVVSTLLLAVTVLVFVLALVGALWARRRGRSLDPVRGVEDSARGADKRDHTPPWRRGGAVECLADDRGG